MSRTCEVLRRRLYAGFPPVTRQRGKYDSSATLVQSVEYCQQHGVSKTARAQNISIRPSNRPSDATPPTRNAQDRPRGQPRPRAEVPGVHWNQAVNLTRRHAPSPLARLIPSPSIARGLQATVKCAFWTSRHPGKCGCPLMNPIASPMDSNVRAPPPRESYAKARPVCAGETAWDAPASTLIWPCEYAR